MCIGIYIYSSIFTYTNKGNGVIQKEHSSMMKIMKDMTTSNERQIKVEKSDKEIHSTSHISTTTERYVYEYE
jgi:hypothetical protein